MKIKKPLYYLLSPIIALNVLILGFYIIYGYPLIKFGIFYNVLIDRPEFSHINDTLLTYINITTTSLVVIGTIWPFLLFIYRNTILGNKLVLTTFLVIAPLITRFFISYIAPAPIYFSETSKGEYRFRIYAWKNGEEKKWISEKPSSAYNYQDRIKWLPLEQHEKNN